MSALKIFVFIFHKFSIRVCLTHNLMDFKYKHLLEFKP